MTSISVEPSWISMLPVYACILTSALLSFVVLPAQQSLRAASSKSSSFGARIVASRPGSGLLILTAAAALMAGEVAILVPLTGGAFA